MPHPAGVGSNAVGHSNYLRNYMRHLRQKLEQDLARPAISLLKPVLGIGLCFEKSGIVWIKLFLFTYKELNI